MATIATTFRLNDDVSPSLRNINNSVNNSVKGFESLEGQVTALNSALDLMQKGVEVIKSVGGVVAGFVSDASEYESLLANLTVVTGDASQAQKEFAELKEFASKTPFDLPGVVQASIMFKSAGMEAKKIIPTIKMLGDASAGNNQVFQDMAMNYMQILSSGKASAQDMKQFATRGLPVIQMMKDMGIEGQATAEQVEYMFQKMTSAGGQFYNSMELNASTLAGTQSNLEDSFQQFSSTIGEAFIPLIKEINVATSEFLGELTNTEAFQSMMDTINTVISNIINNLDSVAATIISVGTIAVAVGTAVTVAWIAVHWQTALVVAIIITLVRAMYDLNVSASNSSNAMGEFSSRTEHAGKIFGAVVGVISTTVKGLMNIIYNVVATVHNALATVVEFVSDIFTNPIQAVAKLFINLATTILNILATVGGAIDLVLSTNISESLGKASAKLTEFKENHFGGTHIERLTPKGVEGIITGGFIGADKGAEVGALLGEKLAGIKYNEPLPASALPTLPESPAPEFKFDDAGNLKTSVQNELKINDEFKQVLAQQAVEKYKIAYSQVTPQISINNPVINNESDSDYMVNELVTKVLEYN